MKTYLTTAMLLLAALSTGCPQPADSTSVAPPEPATEGSSAPTEVDLATIRYDTGDLKEWPDYHFELHHSFDLPEVPAEIIGPFSVDDIPTEE